MNLPNWSIAPFNCSASGEVDQSFAGVMLVVEVNIVVKVHAPHFTCEDIAMFRSIVEPYQPLKYEAFGRRGGVSLKLS
jgi:hypothetical protein